MTVLPYSHFDQLILVAASKCPDALITVNTQTLILNFEQYVKSQLHLNVVHDLFDRDILMYAKALDYLKGDKKQEQVAKEVLFWFYEDVYMFLIRNPQSVVCKVEVPKDLFSDIKRIDYDIQSIKQKLLNFVEETTKQSKPEQMLELLQQFEFAEMFDEVEKLEDIKLKLDNFAVAAMLKKSRETKTICEGENYAD